MRLAATLVLGFVLGSVVVVAPAGAQPQRTFVSGSDCTVESLGNNLVRGNGTDTSGSITVVSGQ